MFDGTNGRPDDRTYQVLETRAQENGHMHTVCHTEFKSSITVLRVLSTITVGDSNQM